MTRDEGRTEYPTPGTVSEAEYMRDQAEHDAEANKPTPKTAVFDIEEFASRLLHARADKRWRATSTLIAKVDAYVARNKMERTIPRKAMYAMEAAKRVPSADDLFLLDAVFQHPEGLAYFMPRK